nr:unnamed protein product [Callosobruchus analis]
MEWELSDSAFRVIVENLGLSTIDLFASGKNKKCDICLMPLRSQKPRYDTTWGSKIVLYFLFTLNVLQQDFKFRKALNEISQFLDANFCKLCTDFASN